MKEKILVTGGAGYIGSHTVRALLNKNYKLVVLDNLYSGHKWSVDPRAEFVQASIADGETLDRVMSQHKVVSVLHFAAHTEVGESVISPLKYFRNNTAGTLALLEACVRNDVRHFIFSSTAAVYGEGIGAPVKETDRLCPINPYGRSKLMTEQMIRDLAGQMSHVVLRYFNAAGAALDGSLGQETPRATHLIKTAAEVACGVRPHLQIFGTDYDTPDGTCIRDYIHVEDLAEAHSQALSYLEQGGDSRTFNCGYGHGTSVLEVVQCFEKILKQRLPTLNVPRRIGDAASVIADNSALRQELNWRAQSDDLETICRTALQWESKLLLRHRPGLV